MTTRCRYFTSEAEGCQVNEGETVTDRMVDTFTFQSKIPQR